MAVGLANDEHAWLDSLACGRPTLPPALRAPRARGWRLRAGCGQCRQPAPAPLLPSLATLRAEASRLPPGKPDPSWSRQTRAAAPRRARPARQAAGRTAG